MSEHYFGQDASASVVRVRVTGHNTTQFSASIGHSNVIVLVGSRSTYNFLDFKLVKRLDLPVEHFSQLHVIVANKVRLITQGLCRVVQWKAQGYDFTTEFMILLVKGCDLVLGIQ
ncbi:hypothetical protein PVK06_019003 [Gossypium arboreum]|uniref:Uncharacterized protein n=1 Tax=Gossypium arboreum TaxID=29729 RepID=A0ABR0PIJ7_GOSAR|nr:hypothetical protein PVK06_019003 [Gossypium arboreum]